MKALAVISCLIGVSTALGGGGCPLNYGDSCGWVEADNGEFCYKPMYHGKDYLDAISVCFNLGNPECPSQLLTVEQVPELDAHADLSELPDYSRIDTFSYCWDPSNETCFWQDQTFIPIGTFPPGFTLEPSHPNDLPAAYDDQHLLTGLWSTKTMEIIGHTPAQDRVSFICTSCVNVEHECPVICEYCIPHNPIDGVWGEWGSWAMECPPAADCPTVMNSRSRMCMPPRYGGAMCWGQDTQEQACPLGDMCPVYVWGEWEAWGACALPDAANLEPSMMCGPGEMSRTRVCVLEGTTDMMDASLCGNPEDVMVVDSTCEVEGVPMDCEDLVPAEWCDWDYTAIKAGCNNATCGFCVPDPPVNATRTCGCPEDKSLYTGDNCEMDEVEQGVSMVILDACEQEIGEWGSWGEWDTDCVNYCIQDGVTEPETFLHQHRARVCEAEKFCLGSSVDRKDCVDQAPMCNPLYAMLTGVGNTLSVSSFDASGSGAAIASTCSDLPTALPDNMAVGMAAAQIGLFPVFCGGMASAEGTFTPEMSCQVFQADGTFSSIAIWEPRVNSVVAQLTQTSFILVGGDVDFVPVSQTTEIVSVEGGAALGPNLPEEMQGVFRPCAISPDPDTLIVAGGMIKGIVTNMAWKYTFSTGEWVELPSMKVKRYNHVCTRRINDDGDVEIYAILGDTGTKAAERLTYSKEGEIEWEILSDTEYLAPNPIIGGVRFVAPDFSGSVIFAGGMDLDGNVLETSTMVDPSMQAGTLFVDATASFPPITVEGAQMAGCFIQDSILELIAGCF